METWQTRPVVLAARPDWEIWLRWVLYTAAGYLIYAGLSLLVTIYVPGALLLSPIVTALGLLAIALLQWLVLRRYILRLGWVGWVVATVLGQFVGSLISVVALLGPILFDAFSGLVDALGGAFFQLVLVFATGLVLGAVVGAAQWLVLRRHVRGAAWWIPASALAGALAALVGQTPGVTLGLTGVAAVLMIRLIGALIIGAITGMALVRLLARTPTPEAPAANPGI
jgi:hypothetical protein